MNRKIILVPLAVAVLGLASCKDNNSSNSPTSQDTQGSDTSTKETITLTVNNETINLKIGEQESINFTISKGDVSFVSDNEAVAKVDEFGKIMAIGEGTAHITVTSALDKSVTKTVLVSVTKVARKKLSSITEKNDQAELYYGVVTCKTTQGFWLEDDTGCIYVYDSASIGKVTVGDFISLSAKVGAPYWGLLELKSPTDITKLEETAPTLREATNLTAEIVNPIQDKIKSQTEGTILPAEYGPYTFTQTAVDNSGHTNFNIPGTFTKPGPFSPSKYAGDTVFQAGVSYTVTGYFGGYHSGNHFYQFYIKTAEGHYDPVESIALNKTSGSLPINGTEKLSATILPATADNRVIWSTSNDKVATVDAKGSVKAVATGNAVITATSRADESKKATFNLTVTSESLETKYYNLVKPADIATTLVEGKKIVIASNAFTDTEWRAATKKINKYALTPQKVTCVDGNKIEEKEEVNYFTINASTANAGMFTIKTTDNEFLSAEIKKVNGKDRYNLAVVSEYKSDNCDWSFAADTHNNGDKINVVSKSGVTLNPNDYNGVQSFQGFKNSGKGLFIFAI